MSDILGFTRHGDGSRRILVLHDWFADHASYDPTLPYLSPERFSYVFADLRGYGRSRDVAGEYSLEEAAADCIALLESLGWDTCALVGHSMSSLVVQRLVQLAPDRVTAVAAVTPVPPTSMQADEGGVAGLRQLAMADDEARIAALSAWWSPRLSRSWVRFKARRWREAARPEAAAAYVEMFGRTDISAGAHGVTLPMLILAGDEDAPPFREDALRSTMLPFYPQARIVTLGGCGHYPMQEQPPLFATVLEDFLGAV